MSLPVVRYAHRKACNVNATKQRFSHASLRYATTNAPFTRHDSINLNTLFSIFKLPGKLLYLYKNTFRLLFWNIPLLIVLSLVTPFCFLDNYLYEISKLEMYLHNVNKIFSSYHISQLCFFLNHTANLGFHAQAWSHNFLIIDNAIICKWDSSTITTSIVECSNVLCCLINDNW